MDPMINTIYAHTQWVQPRAFQNRYELRAGEQVFASLTFPNMFGTLANAESYNGRWTFKRVGFFNVRVTVRKEGEPDDIAVFHPKWTGTQGTAEFTSGESYVWKVANFWATEYVWLGPDNQPIIYYRPGVEDASLADFFKVQSRVEILPEAQHIPHLDLLVALGWYLMILKQHDDAGAVAATSGAV